MPSIRDHFSLRSLGAKRWLLGQHPGLLWGTHPLVRGYGEPEIELLHVLCQPGTTMVDVGASFGMWAYHAQKFCNVLAFEPQPALAAALRRGFRRYGERVRIEQVALSTCAGISRMTTPPLQPGYSTIEASNDLHGKVSAAFAMVQLDVETRTLDSYELPEVTFVKLDAEGHELSVLQGARNTLARHLPALVVETEERHSAGAPEEITELAVALGYRRYFLQDGALRDGSLFSVATHQDLARPKDYVRNLIFLRPNHLASLATAAARLPFALPR